MQETIVLEFGLTIPVCHVGEHSSSRVGGRISAEIQKLRALWQHLNMFLCI